MEKFVLLMSTEERRRLNGAVLSKDTQEKEFNTLDEIRVFIDTHSYLKRVKGTEGKIYRDTKDGPEVVGFLLKGRYSDWEYQWGKRINFKHYETVWCEVFKVTRERILFV